PCWTLERTLSGRNPINSWVLLNGLTERTRECFELHFNNVVGIPAAQQIDVHVDGSVIAEGFENVTSHGTGEVPPDQVVDLSLRFSLMQEIWSAGEVDYCAC